MKKKKLSPLEEEQKLLKLESLYYQNPNPSSIPDRLYHFIKDKKPKLIKTELQRIKEEGLKKTNNPRNTTRFIDKKVNRPQGIYFWDQPISKEVHIEVKVNRLNPNKLYAFPHPIADNILKIDEKYIASNEFWNRLKEIAIAIPFKEYQGQFQSEYIYTDNIPAQVLTIEKIN